MRHWLRLLIVAWLAIGSAFGFARDDAAAVDWVALAELPREARETYALIKQGGPFPYERDGIVFKNFEKRLPLKPRGYYREYTVRSPWRKDRGPRRIVAGADGDSYYTSDHYRTFRRIRE
jgi:ribonuclease T1